MHPASITDAHFRQRTLRAEHLHRELGMPLMQDETLSALLSLLNRSIEDSRREMDSLRVVNECADCAADGAGTCCSERTGNKCDVLLLVINLLLDRTMPVSQRHTGHCYFLSPRGCSLWARPVICINFLCDRLRQNIEHKKLVVLQQIAGREMDALFLVEEYLKKTGLFRN